MNKKKVAIREQEGYAGCVWCLGNMIGGIPCWRLLKKPYPLRVKDCPYFSKRTIIEKMIIISPEKIAEIREALQVIRGEAYRIYGTSCVNYKDEIIIEQVARIDKLLPTVQPERRKK